VVWGLAVLVVGGTALGLGLTVLGSPSARNASHAPVTTHHSGTPATSNLPQTLGLYAGYNNQTGVNSFTAATGSQVTMVGAVLPWAAGLGSSIGWDYLTTPSTLKSWLSSYVGANEQMVLDLPMVALNGLGKPENTLAEGAAGDEDGIFKEIAQNLVSLGFGNAVLRPGWEFDGTWYPWSVRNDTDAANYASFWQKIVKVMNAVPGAHFTFVWSPAGFQTLSWNLADAYPGNAVVNDVSFDVYDWSWDTKIFPSGDPHNAATAAQSKAVFKDLLTDPDGLNWLADFARTHDKRIVIPEWAVDSRTDGHGLGDDPTFINDMHGWFVTNHVAWSIYFNDDAKDNDSQGIDFNLTDFPHSLAAFKADFG
jgi:hypothetical protein